VPSKILSPIWGMITSTAIAFSYPTAAAAIYEPSAGG
jgi:hypothetical protein